ncbi:MAG: hypothetical protein ACOCQD_00925 [archaeon]
MNRKIIFCDIDIKQFRIAASELMDINYKDCIYFSWPYYEIKEGIYRQVHAFKRIGKYEGILWYDAEWYHWDGQLGCPMRDLTKIG